MGPPVRAEVLGMAVRDGKIQMKFALEFFAPLRHQWGGDQDEHAAGQAAQQVFADEQAGLDGFSQAYFVCKEGAAAEMAQHAPHGLNLVRELFDAA